MFDMGKTTNTPYFSGNTTQKYLDSIQIPPEQLIKDLQANPGTQAKPTGKQSANIGTVLDIASDVVGAGQAIAKPGTPAAKALAPVGKAVNVYNYATTAYGIGKGVADGDVGQVADTLVTFGLGKLPPQYGIPAGYTYGFTKDAVKESEPGVALKPYSTETLQGFHVWNPDQTPPHLVKAAANYNATGNFKGIVGSKDPIPPPREPLPTGEGPATAPPAPKAAK
jgi:hypothetical protein